MAKEESIRRDPFELLCLLLLHFFEKTLSLLDSEESKLLSLMIILEDKIIFLGSEGTTLFSSLLY